MSTAATRPSYKENIFRVDNNENTHEEKSKVACDSSRNLNQGDECLIYMAAETASILLKIMQALIYLFFLSIHLHNSPSSQRDWAAKVGMRSNDLQISSMNVNICTKRKKKLNGK